MKLKIDTNIIFSGLIPNDDPKGRLHLDTNASLLTKDYIDELIEAGITDIGIQLVLVHKSKLFLMAFFYHP